ncbi:MAG: hypothetical protein MUF23_10100 [Pirellula sp.]|nr:hypothetical protein [Pirellula sp.]
MAQTALTRILAAVALWHGAVGLVQGQPPAALRALIDAVPREQLDPVSPLASSFVALRLLDVLEPAGRHRFVLPLPWQEARAGAERFEAALKELGIHDEVLQILQQRIDSIRNEVDTASKAIGLQSLLQPTRDANFATIRAGRATAPLSLLGWNSGAYSVAKTPHFVIFSQAGERPTAEMAQACELAFRVWSQLFASGPGSEQTDAPKSTKESSGDGFQVVMFRTRDAYVKALRAIEPNIDVSTGYYSPRNRMSFFYWDGAKSFPTLVHELTHQFFQESNESDPVFDPDKDPGFWAIEGVALYVESLSVQKIGGAAVIDVGGLLDSLGRVQSVDRERLSEIARDCRVVQSGLWVGASLDGWFSRRCRAVRRISKGGLCWTGRDGRSPARRRG